MTMRSRTAAFGVIESPDGVLLVANRRGRGRLDWTPPGGLVDRGESSIEALTREVREESGLMATEWPTLLYTAEVQFREIAQPPKAKPKPKKTKPLVFPAWPPPAVEPEPSPRPCDGLSCPDLVCVADLHFDTEMLWDLGPIARASLEGMSPGTPMTSQNLVQNPSSGQSVWGPPENSTSKTLITPQKPSASTSNTVT